ncbi:hypothetical protein HAX54_037132, partial [Datura stramonium]|nr:hypothetical protein [Datura stramonium]
LEDRRCCFFCWSALFGGGIDSDVRRWFVVAFVHPWRPDFGWTSGGAGLAGGRRERKGRGVRESRVEGRAGFVCCFVVVGVEQFCVCSAVPRRGSDAATVSSRKQWEKRVKGERRLKGRMMEKWLGFLGH